jgi:hypothetical protein
MGSGGGKEEGEGGWVGKGIRKREVCREKSREKGRRDGEKEL